MKKKALKVYFYLICSFYLSNSIFSQSNYSFVTTPEVQALAKYVDFPVSNYTGIAQIQIPLYQIQMKKFKLDIALNYHAKGIQVEEIATNVGLGWSLDAGGIITRAVRHEPDDYNKNGDAQDRSKDGNLNSDEHRRWGLFWSKRADKLKEFNSNSLDPKYVHDALGELTTEPNVLGFLGDGMNDTEPDIFYFNIGGISGKFVFDVSNNSQIIKLIPYQDLTITHTLSADGKIASFKIADFNGNKYYFEAIEQIDRYAFTHVPTPNIITSSYQFTGLEEPISPVNYLNGYGFTQLGWVRTVYNSSWHLTKIVTAEKEDIIFDYDNEEYFNYDQPLTSSWSTYDNKPFPGESKTSAHTTSFTKKRLKSISTKNEVITFSPDRKKREDLLKDSYPISMIDIQNNRGDYIKKYKLNYSYLQNSFQESILFNGFYPSVKDLSILDKRLLLDSITDYGKGIYQFKYNKQDSLPKCLSNQQDHWGFYNKARTNKSLIPTTYVYPKLIGSERFSIFPLSKESYELKYGVNDSFIVPGNDRAVNKSVITAGMLTSIKYPTGGRTEYSYESNEFLYQGETRYGGGVRIKSIKSYSSSNQLTPSMSKLYEYTNNNGSTSGKVLSIPNFASFSGNLVTYAPNNSEFSIFLRNSKSMIQLDNTKGGYVGYTQVTVYSDSLNKTSKTIYNYSFPAAYGDFTDKDGYNISKINHTQYIPGNSYQSSPAILSKFHSVPNTAPFPPNPDYDWNRGLLLSSKDYNSSGNLIREVNYTYDNYYPYNINKAYSVSGLKYGLVTEYDTHINVPRYFLIMHSKYENITGVNKVLTSEVEKVYDTDSKNFILQETHYSYNSPKHMNVTETRKKTNQGILIQKDKYAFDYLGNPTMYNKEGMFAPLYTKNNKLIETSWFLEKNNETKLIKAKLITYSAVSDEIVIPRTEYTLTTNTNILDFKESYDTMDNRFIIDSRYSQNAYFQNYDVYGNPTNILMRDESSIIYLWSYFGQYPIAEIKNSNFEEINTIINIDTLSKKLQPSDDDFKSIRALNTKLPNALITTYTYKPLVGMTSMTDPRGVTTTYEYDSFGRLAKVKDANGKVINTYDYHYQNQ